MAKKILFAGTPPSGILSEQFGSVYPSLVDKQDNGQLTVGASMVVPYSPVDGSIRMPVTIQSISGLQAGILNLTGTKLTSTNALMTDSMQYMYNPANSNCEVLRTPGIWRTGSATAAGQTAVWTPGASKSARIMGGLITVPSIATSAAGSVITLQDSATTIMTLTAIGTTTTGVTYQLVLPGNGYLSSAANNVINLNLSAALTAGAVYVSLWGTEE